MYGAHTAWTSLHNHCTRLVQGAEARLPHVANISLFQQLLIRLFVHHREFAITEVGPDTQATKVQTLVQQRQGRQKQAAPDVEAPEQLTRRPAAATTGSAAVKQVVQPPTHTASSIYTYNACTAVWWLCWTYLLVASHVPQMPPHAAFAKALTNSRTKQLVMPVWGLFAVVYVGLLVLQQAAQVLFTKASSGQNFFTKLLRKEDARVAEHFFPFGERRVGKLSFLPPGCSPPLVPVLPQRYTSIIFSRRRRGCRAHGRSFATCTAALVV